MKYKEVCDHCNHQSVAYTVRLNQPMIIAFNQLVEYWLKHKGPCNVNRDLELTHNQKANFQKLKYFGIVYNLENSSQWVPTKKGVNFYYGRVGVLLPQAHLNNQLLPPDHPAWKTHEGIRKLVKITDIVDTWPYKQREEYQDEKGGTFPQLPL